MALPRSNQGHIDFFKSESLFIACVVAYLESFSKHYDKIFFIKYFLNIRLENYSTGIRII